MKLFVLCPVFGVDVSVSVYVAWCSLKQAVCDRMISEKRVGPDGLVRLARMGISRGGGP